MTDQVSFTTHDPILSIMLDRIEFQKDLLSFGFFAQPIARFAVVSGVFTDADKPHFETITEAHQFRADDFFHGEKFLSLSRTVLVNF